MTELISNSIAGLLEEYRRRERKERKKKKLRRAYIQCFAMKFEMPDQSQKMMETRSRTHRVRAFVDGEMYERLVFLSPFLQRSSSWS